MSRAALLALLLGACRPTPHPTTNVPSAPSPAWAGPCDLEPDSGRPTDWDCASREMARGLRWVGASRPDETAEPERADVMRACPVCFLGQSRDCVACADSWAEEWLRDGDCAWVSPLPQYGAEFTLCPEY